MWSLFIILVIAERATADGYSHDFQNECTNITAPPEVPPRPLNVNVPSSLSVSIIGSLSESNDESEPYEVLKCNKKVRVFDGDAFTIKSPGYPDAAQENETCSWYFYTQDRVGIDIICDEINLPCTYKNFMYLKFGNKRPSKLCTGQDPERTFRDQELSVKAYPSPYWLSVGYGSKNLGNGRGFSCLVMGSGGLTRSDPFQLGRLSAGEDSGDNSEILECPYAQKGRRVVGGQKAGASEFPWMVALIIGSKNLCGGSIIADRWILTAAHCVEGKNPHQLSVRYGCNDRTEENCIMSNRPDLIIIHPDYGFPKNDIALVRLQHRMDVKKQADRRVCLPSKALDRNGYEMVVAGWGKTNDKGSVSKVLRKASVATAPDRNCTDVYGKYFSGLTSVCANGIDGNSCQGDSGSYVGSRTGRGGRTKMEVNGLVSFGARSSCEKAYPMGLTDIYTYNSWIVGVVRKYDEKSLSEISSIVS